jgi:tRNA pseudouridine38-40 synthase
VEIVAKPKPWTLDLKRFLKLTVAYDGTPFVGWQVQPNGVSIQQRLEEAWTKVTGETIRITASGRTDAGVHALAQVCSVATESTLDSWQILRALNAETPYEIAVIKCEDVAKGFHAIRDAVEKTYCYHIQYGRIQDPLRLATCWYVPGDVDLPAMQAATSAVVGTHDFASFQGAHSDRKTTVRTILRFDIDEENVHGFPGAKISISADGFLYNMVRNLVGTVVRIGRGRETVDWMAWVRDQKNRSVAGQTAPAQGLFLDHVVYEDAE